AGLAGLGKDRLQAVAERALSDFAGGDVIAQFGEARLFIGGLHRVGIELRNVRLDAQEDERSIIADRLRFGAATWPLLQGRVELAGSQRDEVRIVLDSATGDAQGLLARMRDERGLFDPDRIARELRDGSNRIYSLLSGRSGAAIQLSGLVIDPVPSQ